MKREILDIKRKRHINDCCPGHDDYPSSTYANNRSKRRRAMDISREHRYVRRVKKHILVNKDN